MLCLQAMMICLQTLCRNLQSQYPLPCSSDVLLRHTLPFHKMPRYPAYSLPPLAPLPRKLTAISQSNAIESGLFVLLSIFYDLLILVFMSRPPQSPKYPALRVQSRCTDSAIRHPSHNPRQITNRAATASDEPQTILAPPSHGLGGVIRGITRNLPSISFLIKLMDIL